MIRERTLNQKLAGFTRELEQAAQRFMDNLDPEIVSDEYGYYKIDEEREVFKLIAEGEEIKGMLTSYPISHKVRGYYDNVVCPIIGDLGKYVKFWWAREYRKKFLDFNLPPAPKLDMAPVKISQREYRAGPFTIKLEKGKWDRELVVYVGELKLFVQGTAIDLKDVKEYLTADTTLRLTYPTRYMKSFPIELKTIAALTDWSQVEHLSPSQKAALKLRLDEVQGYYKERLDIDARIQRNVERKEDNEL